MELIVSSLTIADQSVLCLMPQRLKIIFFLKHCYGNRNKKACCSVCFFMFLDNLKRSANNLPENFSGEIRRDLRERVRHRKERAALQEPAHSERAHRPPAPPGRRQQGALRGQAPLRDDGLHLPLPPGPRAGQIQRPHGHRADRCGGGQGDQALPPEHSPHSQVSFWTSPIYP